MASAPKQLETKHTPGPWTVNCSHIYAPDGAILAQVHNPGSKESDYPLVANRNLMAAAPDLLVAAEQALLALKGVDRLLHENGFMQGVDCPAILILEAVISKARGDV